MPLVFDTQAEIYNKHGINFGTLNHLDNIGLIHFKGSRGMEMTNPPKAVYYYGRRLNLDIPKGITGPFLCWIYSSHRNGRGTRFQYVEASLWMASMNM